VRAEVNNEAQQARKVALHFSLLCDLAAGVIAANEEVEDD
jgi:hypothetical protein